MSPNDVVDEQVSLLAIIDELTAFRKSVDQQLTDFRKSVDQQLTDFRKSVDQQLTDFRKSVDQQLVELNEKDEELKRELAEHVEELGGRIAKLTKKIDAVEEDKILAAALSGMGQGIPPYASSFGRDRGIESGYSILPGDDYSLEPPKSSLNSRPPFFSN